MRHSGWALLLLIGCHDPEAAALRSRVAAQQEEIAKLRRDREPAPRPEIDAAAMRDLEREADLLRGRVERLERAPREEVRMSVNGDQCWVLTWRPEEFVAGETRLPRRLTLATYRAHGSSVRLQSVREIGPDLEMVEYAGDRPTVSDVVRWLKEKKK